MKKFIYVMAVITAPIFYSCNNTGDTNKETPTSVLTDTLTVDSLTC